MNRRPVKNYDLAKRWVERVGNLESAEDIALFHLAEYTGQGKYRYCAVGHLCEEAVKDGLLYFHTFQPEGSIIRYLGYSLDKDMVLNDPLHPWNQAPINVFNGLATDQMAEKMGVGLDILADVSRYNDSYLTTPARMAEYIESVIEWEGSEGPGDE